MTTFKKGDVVIRTGRSHGKLTPGKEYTVANGNAAPSMRSEWITLEGVQDGDQLWEFLAEEFTLVPAVPDPAKVKAGDTVTLTKGETSVRGPVTGISYAGGGEWDFRVGEEPYRRAGRIGLWAVTDHQPAPEPEPEWDGFGSGVVEGERVSGYVSPTGYFYSPDVASPRGRSEVTDFRPLVVIDPATVDENELASIIAGEYGHEDDVARALVTVRVILAELGIEAP